MACNCKQRRKKSRIECAKTLDESRGEKKVKCVLPMYVRASVRVSVYVSDCDDFNQFHRSNELPTKRLNVIVNI